MVRDPKIDQAATLGSILDAMDKHGLRQPVSVSASKLAAREMAVRAPRESSGPDSVGPAHARSSPVGDSTRGAGAERRGTLAVGDGEEGLSAREPMVAGERGVAAAPSFARSAVSAATPTHRTHWGPRPAAGNDADPAVELAQMPAELCGMGVGGEVEEGVAAASVATDGSLRFSSAHAQRTERRFALGAVA